jgi:hypothetical protein
MSSSDGGVGIDARSCKPRVRLRHTVALCHAGTQKAESPKSSVTTLSAHGGFRWPATMVNAQAATDAPKMSRVGPFPQSAGSTTVSRCSLSTTTVAYRLDAMAVV